MVLAPGSFFIIGTKLFCRSRGFVLDLRGIVSYTSRGQLKACKIVPRADFKIILALLPRKRICTEQTL